MTPRTALPDAAWLRARIGRTYLPGDADDRPPHPAAAVALAFITGCPSPRDFIEYVDDTSCGRMVGGRCTVNDDTGHQFCATLTWPARPGCAGATSGDGGFNVMYPNGTGIAPVTSRSPSGAFTWAPSNMQIAFPSVNPNIPGLFVATIDSGA